MIIYKIMNKLTGEEYVGKTTKTLEERIKVHIRAMKSSNQYVHRAMVKYGLDNFSWMALEEVTENLDEREKYWIRALDTLAPNGYNLTIGGDGGDTWSSTGRKHSDETKAKIGRSSAGRKFTDEQKKRMSEQRRGRKISDAAKIKIGLAHKGRKLSEEHKAKISKSSCGKINFWTGKKFSNEHRKNISLGMKRKKRR